MDGMRGDHTPRLVTAERPMIEIVRWARLQLARGVQALELVVPDPDAGAGAWPGAARPDGAPQRDWRAWLDLAELLGCRCCTPVALGDGPVLVRFERLGQEAAWHGGVSGPERYAGADGFAQVHKLEQPGFLVPLLAALERTRPSDGGRVLVLGCHRGDEIEALSWLEPSPRGLEVVGVDHAPGPLAQARRRFPDARFLERDVRDLPETLGRFELVLAIAVLQGPGVDDKTLLRRLVQHHLQPRAGLVLGFPNSRFRDGAVVWGARTRNYAEPDLSLVVRDLAAHRRYLHQHGFASHLGGRYDLLLSAWRGRRDHDTDSTGAAAGDPGADPPGGSAGGSAGSAAGGPSGDAAGGSPRRGARSRTIGGSAR